MPDFECDIVTPTAKLASEEVEMVVVPGIEGEMGFLKGHAALLSVLADGPVRFHVPPNGEIKQYALQGGYVQVSAEKVIILADRAIPADEIDAKAVEQELESIESQINNLSSVAEDEERKKELLTQKAWLDAQVRATKKDTLESN